MNIKGISIWEQYIERILLGVAVLFCLVFSIINLLHAGETVDIPGTSVPMSAQNSEEVLRAKARELATRLTDDHESPVEFPPFSPIHDSFRQRLTSGVSPEATIASTYPALRIGEIELSATEVAYVEFRIPAPIPLSVTQHFDALADEEMYRVPELGDRFPERPYDLTWNTVAATIDLAEIRRQYEGRAGGDGAPLPLSWYKGRIDILDVLVEREELIGNTWTDLQLLDVLPGAYSLRPRLFSTPTRSERDDMLWELYEEGRQAEIIQPAFYALVNDSWVPPTLDDPLDAFDPSLSAEQQEIRHLQRRLRDAQKRREQLHKQIEELGGPSQGSSEGRGKGRGGGRVPGNPEQGDPGSGRGRGGGGPPSGGDRRPAGEGRSAPGGGLGLGPGGAGGGGEGGMSEERRRARVEGLERQIEKLDRQIRGFLDDLAELGVGLEEEDSSPDEVVVSTDILGEDLAIIWAHDITAQPGNMYRYRFTVNLYNPFFSRRLDLVESQRVLADDIASVSQVSDWSEPKEMIAFEKIFITKAYGNEGDLGLGRATAEVYRFSHGRWWRDSFQVEPGDLVGSVERVQNPAPGMPGEIDFKSDWFVLDIVPDLDAGSSRSDSGLGARVILQRLDASNRTRVDDPTGAQYSLERRRLEAAVDEAESMLEGTGEEKEEPSGLPGGGNAPGIRPGGSAPGLRPGG